VTAALQMDSARIFEPMDPLLARLGKPFR
jgi:hypothetical protein